jgi:hypothetical protein
VDDDGQGGRAALPLLRRLSIGLGVYRLYPDDPTWPSFVASVERVRESAEAALTAGPFVAEIQGRAIKTREGPLPEDDLLGRLALACYERGAQRLSIRAAPDADDLTRLYQVLTIPVDEVERLGGAERMLRDAGVSSIVLGEVTPSISGPVDSRTETFPNEELAIWDRLRDPAALAAQLLAGGTRPGEQPDPAAVLRRMEALASMLPEGVSGQVSLYERLQEVISHLPADLRRKLLASLIEQLKRKDRLAERLVGIMSDAELARALVDLGQDGHDPVQLARSVAVGPGGRAHLADLTAALMEGHEEAGTIMAGIDTVGTLDERVWERSASVLGTVSDLLARDLKATESEDLRTLQHEMSQPENDGSLPWLILGDYLRLESSPSRLRDVLALWTQEAREALRHLDAIGLAELLVPIEAAGRAGVDSERLEAFRSSMRGVIDASLAAELCDPGANEVEVRKLLVRFGPPAMESLFDVLAAEQDRGSRTRLLGLLRSLPSDSYGSLASRLVDPRWYVVRNAVHVLSRSGGRDAVPLIKQAARHSSAPVRREAIQGLVSVAGDEAVPLILEMAQGDPNDAVRTAAVVSLGGLLSPDAVEALASVVRSPAPLRVRRLALEQLGGHPAPEAAAALEQLASRRARPRLPRALRFRARQAVKERLASR